jgi:hypothetical protein
MKFDSELMLKPMLIGGIVGGILSSIPIIHCLNCCCLLYAGSGAITAYLILKKTCVEMNDLAIAGAGSGAITGSIKGVLAPLFFLHNTNSTSMMGDDTMAIVGERIARDILVLNIPITMVLGAVFGAIGAIIYGMVYEEWRRMKHGR